MTYENVATNLRESFRVIAASRGAGELRELPGVSIASAGVSFQMFNAAFLSEPVENEAELARRAALPAVHFHARGLEWAYWVCEDFVAPKLRRRIRPVLERQGLRHSVDLPGMMAERILPPAKVLPAIDVRRVEGKQTRDEFCSIGSVCFHVPIVWFCEVFDSNAVWQRFRAYVGYANGEPVATAAIVLSGDTLGVYNVATLPEHQRRGYGEAVMRAALADAQRELGTSRVILQSTVAGYRLYERMGFRTITTVGVYAS